MQEYFEVNNLTKQFKTGAGVKNITFSIKKGQIVGFVGPNGAGKTTTIRLIFGLIKRDSGEVFLNGKDLLEENNLARIAFFPDQNNYPNTYKIKDYIVYNGQLSGLKRNEASKRADKLLEFLALSQNKHQTFKKLSSGMQKRALLASVLITDPEIIVLDEPTANLDVNARIDFMNLLVSLTKKGATIIITSHIIAELQDVVNQLMILKDGNLVYNNAFDHQKEKIQEIYAQFHNESAIGSKELFDAFKEVI